MHGARRRVRLVMAAVLLGSLIPAASVAPAGATAPTDPLDLAISHVRDNAAEFGLGGTDVAELTVTSQVKSKHNGVTHVNLNQNYRGLEVFGANGTVNISADGRVLFVGESFAGGLEAASSANPDLDATAAVESAASSLGLAEPDNLIVLEDGGTDEETIVSAGGISDAPIPARLGWQPSPGGLRLAWQVTIDSSSSASLWNATVDASTGILLAADDWTDSDDIGVLSSTLSRAGSTRARTSVNILTPFPAEDGSSYRVLEIPKESPLDGPFNDVSEPADERVSPFGWHDNGVTSYTTTQGNNVHAFMDQDANNQPDFGSSPDNAGLDFLEDPDLNEHAQAYRDAATTNLFYWNNVIHDITALYGFDEAADNFQTINYGGGGNGDYVRAEAADGNGTNNANFSTPSAGGTPRMQMYLWPGNQFGSQNQVTVGADAYGAGWARFGPPAPSAGISGALFDAGNGCAGAYTQAPASPWIAIVVGGTAGCQPIDKARAASAAGAAAIIMSTGTSSTGIIASNSGGMNAASPTIPSVLVTTANGTAIRAAMPTTATVRKHPDHPGIRDGDLDVGIIVHEYTHGISNRLTGGPGVNCLSGNEQAGEGWGDYLGITMTLNPDIDDPEGPRGMGPYALFQGSHQGNGIRPRPYSRNMEIQPFTYDSIKSNGWLNNSSLALPHGLGHGWASILWDLNWNLIDKHGYNPNLYEAWNTGGNNRALQYVMDGMKFQGCGPTLLTSARAVIAAADVLSNGEDYCTVYATFARRGFGYSAVDGTTNRNDNDEAFDTDPNRCLAGFTPPVPAGTYGTLNPVVAGEVLPLKFPAGPAKGLASGAPYSRLVDCATLRTVDVNSPFITPRPIPVPAVRDGNMSYNKTLNRYHYNWVTDASWAGTCRELVVTRWDGVQSRAFFEFLAPPE